MVYVVIALIVVALVVFFLRRGATYYGKIFSDGHYREIADWLNTALKLGPIEQPRMEDGSAIQTSAGCALSFTRTIDEKDSLNIAVSQVGQHTTHAVSNRLLFLILRLLNSNKAEANLFYTESGVHHLVLAKEVGEEWVMNDLDPILPELPDAPQLPFQFESTAEAKAEGADPF